MNIRTQYDVLPSFAKGSGLQCSWSDGGRKEVMLLWTKSTELRRMIMGSSLMLLFQRGSLMVGPIDMRVRPCHTDCVAGVVIGLPGLKMQDGTTTERF